MLSDEFRKTGKYTKSHWGGCPQLKKNASYFKKVGEASLMTRQIVNKKDIWLGNVGYDLIQKQ